MAHIKDIKYFNTDNTVQKSGSIFSTKEMYEMAHTSTGKATFLNDAYSKRRMYRYDNNHLADYLNFTERNEFPILNPYNGTTDFEVLSYKERKKLDGKGQAIHFFMYDDLFRCAVWDKLEQTTYSIRKFETFFAPDFSLFVDRPTPVNKINIYRSRFVAAYWQYCGYNVIPTASWSDADSFEYCFEGLPIHSVIAVCGVGVNWCPAAYELWLYGIRQIEERLSPTLIFVYGGERDIPNIHTPIKYIQDNITKFHRK